MFSLTATVIVFMLALVVCRYTFPIPINTKVVNVTESGSNATNASAAMAVVKPEMPICATDDEHDKQVKTVRKYLLVGYFIFIFIVVILCCTVPERLPVKYTLITRWMGSFGVRRKIRVENVSSKLFACNYHLCFVWFTNC